MTLHHRLQITTFHDKIFNNKVTYEIAPYSRTKVIDTMDIQLYICPTWFGVCEFSVGLYNNN